MAKLLSVLDTATMTNKPWFVYIIKTDKGNLYTGISTDVDRRFNEHLDAFNRKPKAKGAKFFYSQKPLAVIYQQSFSSRSEASKKEAAIKKLSKQEKVRLIQSLNTKEASE